MNLIENALKEGKALWSSALAAYASIKPAELRYGVAVLASFITVVLFFTVLPWLGLVVAVALIALICVAAWRAINPPKP